MNRMKNCIGLTCVLLVSATLSLGTGCQSNKLAEPGPYKGDEILYAADKTITSSYRILHSFVKWEYTHRALLPPEVSHAADAVRGNASRWIDSAIALREAYAVSPTAENRNSLEKTISILEAALTEAAKYMAEHEQKLSREVRP